jgi:glycosyltransferase involved in cell wall biosynthesis
MNKLISIVTPTYNEVDNIEILYTRLNKVWENHNNYNFELLIIDNASSDGTIEKLKTIASHDMRVKVIINNKNFRYKFIIISFFVRIIIKFICLYSFILPLNSFYILFFLTS